jgi:putative tryptophan/tyrosine transport system substrate-binding protein
MKVVGRRERMGNSHEAKLSGFALFALLLMLGNMVQAQQSPRRIPRIGYVRVVGVPSVPAPNVAAFQRGLRELGYIEGENIVIEFRYAEGNRDRIAALVTELVQHKVDVLVSGDAPTIRAAKQITTKVPIVMVINQDPVITGLVQSLARPGGNITGVSRLTRELSGKRLELLREINPAISRVGVLWDETGEGSKISFNEYQTAARTLKIQLLSMKLQGSDPDLMPAFQSVVNSRAGALITIGNSTINRRRKEIITYANKHHLPSMYESNLWIEPGGLISYSSDNAESYRRAATYVDKILKGSNPADLPVEQPTKFELVINVKTAKQIGLTIPPNVLPRADRIIR